MEIKKRKRKAIPGREGFPEPDPLHPERSLDMDSDDTVAWDDANYAVDEQWAVLYPRSEAISATEAKSIELRIANHSSESRNYTLKFNLPENIVSADNLSPTITIFFLTSNINLCCLSD